jgi:hypothetical protein
MASFLPLLFVVVDFRAFLSACNFFFFFFVAGCFKKSADPYSPDRREYAEPVHEHHSPGAEPRVVMFVAVSFPQ